MSSTPDSPAPRSPRPAPLRWAIVGMIVAFGLAAAYGLRGGKKPPPPPPSISHDDDLPEFVVTNPGYVGIDACVECHASRVADVKKTNHFRACRKPEDGEMPPGFDEGRGTHVCLDAPVRFEMARMGQQYFQTAIRKTPTGTDQSTLKIGHVYGAGKVDEVNFGWRGNLLFEMPVAWLHPLNRWGNVTINRHGSGDFTRDGTFRCQECHSTWFEHKPATANEYNPNSFMFGISCEKCHGPGAEHVAYHKANPKAESKGIVHPGNLDRERLMEVCTQCHSNSITPRGHAFSYRPGQPLDDHFRTLVTRFPEQDHVANQGKYLRQSKCFQQSQMTCVTCHDPHRPTNHAEVSNSCKQCHESKDCKEQPKLPLALRNECSACHMPSRVWMNVHFHTSEERFTAPIPRSDHRIAVHPETRDKLLLDHYRKQPDAESKRKADGLSASLRDHWLKEADERVRDHRFLGAIGASREAFRADPSPAVRKKLDGAIDRHSKFLDSVNDGLHLLSQGRNRPAAEVLAEALKVKPDHVGVRGQLGKAYYNLGERDRAIQEWRKVSEFDPNDAYGHIAIGWEALREGRYEEALAEYTKAEKIEPLAADVAHRKGVALLNLNRLGEADTAFRRAIEIDPWHTASFQQRSEVLRRQGETKEAVRYARRAARLSKFEDGDVLMTLAEAYASAGMTAEGRDIARKVFALTERLDPNRRAAIDARLVELGLAGR